MISITYTTICPKCESTMVKKVFSMNGCSIKCINCNFKGMQAEQNTKLLHAKAWARNVSYQLG